MQKTLKILSGKYFEEYTLKNPKFLENFKSFLEKSNDLNFEYLTESSSVFSLKIEGNSLDLNSFMNMKLNSTKSKDLEEIENLIKSYNFAQKNNLDEKNFLNTHKIASESLLIKSKRGKYRDDKVGVFGKEGLIYLAIEPEYVKIKMGELFEDIKILKKSELSIEEVFYYSSQIHLKFVHIHPFSDGNGRSARLLEKWFLSEKLGKDLWKLKSEEFYFKNRENYYSNINLGVNYYEINYNNSILFMLMLVESLKY
ncbi:MAG: Fic family protein [Candidatus Gracilibacteria bacterium]|nr:Fic family protein [Candidatus Gracilibacteria bacterium]MDQ7023833.1 Fic family protein [Candidatus Gracilibacteria bacterium]